MGKQINFLMDNEFEEKFLEYVLSEGVVLFEGNNMSPVRIETLPEPFSEKGWFKLYLYKEEYGKLKLNKLDTGREYIDLIASPVIEFSRTIIRHGAKEVSRGRLWIEMKFYNDRKELVMKSKEIDDWYKKLNQWIKKNLPKTEIITKNRTYSEHSCKYINDMVENGYKVM